MDAKEFVTSHPNTEGPKPALYPDGIRVRLCSTEGDPDVNEEGTILSHDWNGEGYSYVVEVDERFCETGDDGLRELDEEQIIAVLTES